MASSLVDCGECATQGCPAGHCRRALAPPTHDKYGQPLVPCKYCGKGTPMTGTRQCDSCWSVSNAVQHNPELARRVLAELNPDLSKGLLYVWPNVDDSYLRKLRNWHWWEFKRRTGQKRKTQHMLSVQALNVLFPIGDNAGDA